MLCCGAGDATVVGAALGGPSASPPRDPMPFPLGAGMSREAVFCAMWHLLTGVDVHPPKKLQFNRVPTGATCGDIEAVDVTHGDWNKFRPIVGAWENFAKVYPGEFLTAHGSESPQDSNTNLSGVNLSDGAVNGGASGAAQGHCGAETVAWICNKETRTQALVFRNEYLRQVSFLCSPRRYKFLFVAPPKTKKKTSRCGP